MKVRPFLNKTASRLFIGTIILVQPYWVVEIYANFTYFHNVNDLFLRTRPWEALCRDPWWILSALILIYNIKTKYDLTSTQIVRISPRFAVMMGAMFLSIIFIILDVLAVTTSAFRSALPVGINPFWKLSFVFKCLTDSVVLDDFKTALDRLRAFKLSRLGSFAMDAGDDRNRQHKQDVHNTNSWSTPPPKGDDAQPIGHLPPMPSPDDDLIRPQWEDIKPARTDHVENGDLLQPARAASRDRDVEENTFQVVDYGDPQREASDTQVLRTETSWLNNGKLSDDNSDGPDVEYAMAVRQMTNDSSNDSKRGKKSIGGAR